MRTIPQELLKYATPEELRQIEEAYREEQALASPLDYALYVSPGTEETRHGKLLNEHIVALVEHRLYKSCGPSLPAVRNSKGSLVHPVTGEPACLRLKIDMPPRHGKSYLVSEHLPAWFVSKWPDKRVILCSYEADFAGEWGGKALEHVKEHPELGAEVHPRRQANSNWGLKGHRGGMSTAGAGGPITGKGANLLVIDDPIKNAEDAQSETLQKKLWEWWITTAKSRLDKPSEDVAIQMATRWHESDLSGQIEEKEGDEWYTLSLPALAYEDADEDGVAVSPEGVRDGLGRKPGEALWPERIPADVLELIRKPDPQWFQALYQGRPTMEAGNGFKQFQYYTFKNGVYELHYPDGQKEFWSELQCIRFSTIDLATSLKTRADWSVYSVWDVTPNRKLVLRTRHREKVPSDQHEAWVRKWSRKYRPRFNGVEDITFGKDLKNRLVAGGGIIVKSLEGLDRDKWTRSIGAQEMHNNAQIFLPQDAEWITTWVDEHKAFPNGKHDDQVDTTSYAGIVWEKIPARNVAQSEDWSIEARMERYVVDRFEKSTLHPEIGYM